MNGCGACVRRGGELSLAPWRARSLSFWLGLPAWAVRLSLRALLFALSVLRACTRRVRGVDAFVHRLRLPRLALPAQLAVAVSLSRAFGGFCPHPSVWARAPSANVFAVWS